MKNFKGTPGQWKVNEVDDDDISEMSSTMVVAESLVIACVGPTGNTDFKSDIDNANLIAAAPDLLSALQLIISYHDDGNCELHSEDVVMARSAISKALGEE